MQRTKVICQYCGKEISKSNITKHEENCKNKIKKVSYALTHDGLTCQFCGKECKNRNSLCNHERMCKMNPDRQTSAGFNNYNEKVKHGELKVWNAGLTKASDIRVQQQAKTLKKYYETHEGSWTGRQHTEEEKLKIGAGVKAFLLEHPDMVPYLRNHSSNESYPEKYFKKVFDTEGLNLLYHYRISTYELDFCSLDKKLDIEIDGEQHYLDPKIIESDKRRTEYLENLGWTIFRIRWADFKKYSNEEKIRLINTVKNLLA